MGASSSWCLMLGLIDPQTVVAASGVIMAALGLGITRWIAAARRQENGTRPIRVLLYGVPRYGRTSGAARAHVELDDSNPEVVLRTIYNIQTLSGAWVDKEREVNAALERHQQARARAGMEALW